MQIYKKEGEDLKVEYEKIKQLMEDMGNSKISSINIDFPDGTKISMKKESQDTAINYKADNMPEYKEYTEERTIENKKIIKSPMVGTFYLKPSPTSAPYVEVGKHVNKGDTLCIIEAMKLMNEIESDSEGNVVQILVKDGETVEYGTELFIIE